MTQQVTSIDEAEQAKQKAIYSYNVIDITNLLLPFENKFNPHPVNTSRVMSVRNALLVEGFRVFAQENHIIISKKKLVLFLLIPFLPPK